MKPVMPTISAATMCVVRGTATSALYFGLLALLCRLISNGFAAGKNSSATWAQVAQFGLVLGLAAGFVCSSVLTLIACWSADLPAMRKKFALQFMLVLLAGAVLAATAGAFAQWDGGHGGVFVVGLAERQRIDAQTALANLIFGCATMGVISAVALCILWPWMVPHAAKTALRDLVLPFNVTKYLVVVALLIGTIWGFSLPSSGLLQATYEMGFGSVMWGVATLYLCDFAAALTGRSSPYWQKFYNENKTDLYVCGITGLTLVLVLTLSPERYSWYSLDLALLGLPFFLYAIFAIHECATIEIAGHKLPLGVRIALCLVFAILYALTILVLLNVQSKTMPEYEALWYQISIFCSGLSALIFARQIPYMLKQGKVEPSPVFLALFSGIKSSFGIYAEIARAAQQWNEHVKLEKAEKRKEKARASKRRRR